MNKNDFCVLDFETGGRDPETCEPIQLAAKIVNGRTLAPYPDGDFSSFIKPESKEIDKWPFFENLEKGALDVNKINPESLKTAPTRKQVWEQFVEFIQKFNPGNNNFNAPILCAYNVEFDKTIVNRICQQYGPVDKKTNKSTLFNKIWTIDIMAIIFMWFENNKDVERYNLDTVRDYLGISKDGVHNAVVDVQQESAILVRFLNYHRNLAQKTKFKGSFSE